MRVESRCGVNKDDDKGREGGIEEEPGMETTGQHNERSEISARLGCHKIKGQETEPSVRSLPIHIIQPLVHMLTAQLLMTSQMRLQTKFRSLVAFRVDLHGLVGESLGAVDYCQSGIIDEVVRLDQASHDVFVGGACRWDLRGLC